MTPARLRPLALLVMIAAPGSALAHAAPAGWEYDGWCCGGHDCEPIPTEAVEITPQGFLVTLEAGEHIMAREDHRKLFHYDEVRQSKDEFYHACILATQEMRCLYVPPFGQ